MAAAPDEVVLVLVIGAAVLLGLGARAVHAWTRVSELALLLAAGVLAGPVVRALGVTGQGELLVLLAPLALILVLFEAGLGLAWQDLRAHGAEGARTAVLAWTLTAVGATLAAWHLLSLPLPVAALLGLALSATSLLVVVPLLASVNAPARARVALTFESALGNLLSVIGVTTLTAVIVTGASWTEGVALLAVRVAGGVGLGALIGFALSRVLHDRGNAPHAWPFALAGLLVGYACAEAVGGSGFMAVLVIGACVANASALSRALRLPVAPDGLPAAAHAQHAQVLFLLKSVYFVLFGAAVTLEHVTPGVVAAALGIGIVLVVARALAVALAFGRSGAHDVPGERALVASTCPRGLATLLIAGLPAAAGIPGTSAFPVVTLVVLLVTDLATAAGATRFVRVRLRARAPASTERPISGALLR